MQLEDTGFQSAVRPNIRELKSNDDGDGNENGKKAIGLDKQNNNFVRASRFFVHFFTVAVRLQRENART